MRVQIDGMRMDLVKPRYATYDELYEYCYKVAGTVGLMTTPVMGVDPVYTVGHPHSCLLRMTAGEGWLPACESHRPGKAGQQRRPPEAQIGCGPSLWLFSSSSKERSPVFIL